MATFTNRGSEAIAKAAERRSGGGKFTPQLSWKAGDTKYVQFLHSIDDAITVLYHEYIIVDHRDDGSNIYRSFVSRRDPQLDGRDGYDELEDRFGLKPKSKTFGLAVELEPVTGTTTNKSGKTKRTIEGFKVAEREYTDREGEEHSVPAIGLVVQAPGNFWGWLATFAEDDQIEDFVFRVTRRGGDTDTAYDFMPAGEALTEEELDIPEELLLDLDQYLADLADEDRMRDAISGLPDDFKVTRYPPKDAKKGGKQEKKSGAASRRKPKVEEPEEDGDEDSGEEETPASTNKFAQLRKKMA